jgi:hypothetical protein
MILILTCLLVGAALPCPAQAPAMPEALMKKLMIAVENNDYASFVADGIPEFKAGVTPQILEGVSLQIASRMKQIEANFETYPRDDIKSSYTAMQESQMRLFMMRSQLEQLQGKQQ